MKGLIIISHPGHEVAAYHFMHQYKSQVYCLTDGSSSNGIARHYDCHHNLISDGLHGYINVDSLLQEVWIYKSILNQDLGFFQEKVSQPLGCILGTVNPDIILIDAYEGYNPIHDLLHLCAMQASKHFITQHPETICMEIKLTDQDYYCPRKRSAHSFEEFFGTECSIQKKINYATRLSEYIKEIPSSQETLKKLSSESERFSSVDTNVDLSYFLFSEQPFYERHGKLRVKQGKFHEVIEFDKHIFPLIRRMYDFS